VNQEEFNNLIGIVFAEYETPGARVRWVWWDSLSGIEIETATAAVRLMLRGQIYGKPRLSDFWAAYNTIKKESLPKSLTMTPAEALENQDAAYLLIRDAAEFAARVSPSYSDSHQYRSPEELAQAQRIDQATWEREFKQRFDIMQKRALALVNLGREPREAIKHVLVERGTIRHAELGHKMAKILPLIRRALSEHSSDA
jgi:hypothetical protein